MVCFMYIVVNTKHEGDNKNDNINNNSIYFNGRFYVSTKKQINHKTVQIYKNKTLDKQHNNKVKENNIKEVMGQRPQPSKTYII